MKRTILLKSFVVEFFNHWKKYTLILMAITIIILTFLMLNQPNMSTIDNSAEITTLQNQIDTAVKTKMEVESYLENSRLAAYNPLNLPTLTQYFIPVTTSREDFDKIAGQVSSMTISDEFYTLVREHLAEDVENQYLGEIITVSYETASKLIKVNIHHHNEEIAKDLADLVRKNLEQSLKLRGVIDIRLETASTAFSSIENAPLRDKLVKYRGDLERANNLIVTNESKIAKLQYVPEPPSRIETLIRRVVYAGVAGLIALVGLLGYKVTSNKASLLTVDLRETYLLPLLFGLQGNSHANKFESSETRFVPMIEARNMLEQIVQVYSTDPVLIVSSSDTEKLQALASDSANLISGGTLFSTKENYEALRNHDEVILAVDPYKITHQAFQEQLLILNQMKKTIIGVVVL